MSEGWCPKTTKGLQEVLIQLYDKIEKHGPTCGLTPPEIGEGRADISRLLFLKQKFYPAVTSFAKEVTAYKAHAERGNSSEERAFPHLQDFLDVPPLRPAGMLTRIITLVNKMKLSPGYTDFIGQDLLIVPLARNNGSDYPYPPFSLSLYDGAYNQIVRIDFKKFKHNSVYVECRRNGGPWEFLTIDNAKPYLDNRPLLVEGVAETREYRLRWWDKGTANGPWSPIQSISVTA